METQNEKKQRRVNFVFKVANSIIDKLPLSQKNKKIVKKVMPILEMIALPILNLIENYQKKKQEKAKTKNNADFTSHEKSTGKTVTDETVYEQDPNNKDYFIKVEDKKKAPTIHNVKTAV